MATQAYMQQSSNAATALPDVMLTAVMGTNDACTVSQRSVEMLYYPKPHFYRYFVKKPKKRTALINRGYLLQMRTIEYEMKSFLQSSHQRKVVVSLGCGYDALPFRALSRFPDLCVGTTFVDVDYEALIREKVLILKQSPEILDLVGNVQSDSTGPVEFHSEKYLALGCDLSKPGALESFLVQEYGSETAFFFTSEVSLTSMPVETADAVVSWIAKLKHAKFCLLEQFLPAGPDHPFAMTMLKHFNKLSSPLRVVQRYQSLQSQQDRFRHYGWKNIRAQSLWKIWVEGKVFTAADRKRLRSVEVFDEHEEFALFAAHHFMLIADSGGPDSSHDLAVILPSTSLTLSSLPRTKSRLSPRKDGCLFESADGAFAHHAGEDGQRRLSSSIMYTDQGNTDLTPVDQLNIPARKFHTITLLNDRKDYLLVGGRNSPSHPFRDCWLRRNASWTRVDDLPFPLFRHSASLVQKDNVSRVVVFGGKTQHDKENDAWLSWTEHGGWKQLEPNTVATSSRFGLTMTYFQDKDIGILLGGFSSSEIVADDAYTWTVSDDHVVLRPLTISQSDGSTETCQRAGAAFVQYNGQLLLIGGITNQGLPADRCSLTSNISRLELQLSKAPGDVSILASLPGISLSTNATEVERPLLVGHSAVVQDDQLHIVGGGAICFSFGIFMNSTSWHLSLTDSQPQLTTGRWKVISAEKQHQAFNATTSEESDDARPKNQEIEIADVAGTTQGFIAIKKVPVDSKDTLSKRITKGKPCIFESADLGSCTSKWTTEYLKGALNQDLLFDIHHAHGDTMRFESKNFKIEKETFRDFIDAVNSGQKRYLRAVSQQDKYKPANFYQDFDAIAEDFKLPTYLQIPEDQQHSSVFRISGPVNMWLHYDTLSNILCQIRGTKRLILFSPSDVANLGIPPGRSSSDVNVFEASAWETTSLRHTHPYEAILEPGDVLYIPPFWCHAALPLDNVSVAINTFFKTEGQNYANGKDTYGNKDVSEYEYARNDINKAIGRFSTMPEDTQRFYLERLADEILQKARKKT